MITVVLMQPEKEENVGSIARVMKNFGFESLMLVEPKCNHLGNKAQATASHAFDILQKAQVLDKKSFLDHVDYLVGTTAILGDDANLPRLPLLPGPGAKKIA